MTDRYEGLKFGAQQEPGEARRRRRHGLLHRLRRRPPALRIDAYHGWGTAARVYLKGRVRQDPGIRPADADSGRLANLENTLRRALTDEVPHARVRAHVGDEAAEAVADRKGFFGLAFPLQHRLSEDRSWHTAELELLDPRPDDDAEVRTTARILVPSTLTEYGVISDIDDTVVRTDVTDVLSMVRILLLTSAHSRMPFDHVDLLYRALRRGSDGGRENPIFYLSSSPWNFYDLLEEFFRVHGIPEGPLLLRDWNFSPRKLLGMGHQEHKLVRIRHLFQVYPELRWVLIGDSGQEDPEIYREVVREHPGRVMAIYIRDVTSARRGREVHAIAEEVRVLGSEMRLVEQKSEAARHAAERGWITAESLQPMIEQERADGPDPGPKTGTLLDRIAP